MDKETRNRIQRATQAARTILELDYKEQLEGTYDILLDGTIADEPGTHLDAPQQVIRAKIVDAIEHLRAGGLSSAEAVKSFRREAAFTTLNRFAALKMLEARELVRECISKGEQSSGFKNEYCGLAAGLSELPDHGYRIFLESIFDEVGREVRVLFDRRDPVSLLWPKRQSGDRQPFRELLDILNADDLTSVWGQDETVGWIYQYFNTEEERREMREASPTPRNTRELAVRNQFFTPRYVVEFLTENTVGRIWYEMRKGDTVLAHHCKYLVRRPNEVFVTDLKSAAAKDGVEDEGLSQDALLQKRLAVSHRAKKDPRDLKVLDPACGSGHFLLYAFELLLKVYEEAWADPSSPASYVTGRTLSDDYSDLRSLRVAMPELMLRHNLHGIDIDERCVQIAQLSLWMRAQKAFNEHRIPRHERPRITRTNVALAEPMSADSQLRRTFVGALPNDLRRIFGSIAEELELAADAGSLLKVEQQISNAVREATGEIGGLFSDSEAARWTATEDRLVAALKRFSDTAATDTRYRRRLFAEDAARSLAFIDLLRLRYDVVLMNPPFGDRPEPCDTLLCESYPRTSGDLYGMFFERALELTLPNGRVGVISNRTWLGLPTFEPLRSEILGHVGSVDVGVDLGSFVLEAQVETSAVVIARDAPASRAAPWIRLLKTKAKQELLERAIAAIARGVREAYVYHAPHIRFRNMPSTVIGYWMSPSLVSCYRKERSLLVQGVVVKQGASTADDARFLRLRWEVNPAHVGQSDRWAPFAKGGDYSPFFDDVHLVLKWNGGGREIAAWGKGAARNTQYFGRPGVTWPRRTTSPFGPRVLPAGCAFGDKGPAAFPPSDLDPALLLAILSSRPIRLLLSVRLGAGDDAPGSASKSYEVGLVRDLPLPDLNAQSRLTLQDSANRSVVDTAALRTANDETSTAFVYPDVLWSPSNDDLRGLVDAHVRRQEDRELRLLALGPAIDRAVALGLGFSGADDAVMREELQLPVAELPETIDPRLDDVFRQAYLTKSALPGELLPGGLEAEQDVRVETRRKKQVSLRTLECIARVFEASPGACVARRRALELLRKEDLTRGAAAIVSYAVGVVLGHWDLSHWLQGKPPTQLDPLAPPTGLPIGALSRRSQASSGPIGVCPGGSRTAGAGIAVDDPGHPLDIEAAINSVLERIFGAAFEKLRGEISATLSDDVSIRSWLRADYFAQHIRAYSKSRRNAPIYWQLATTSASYSVWLYQHALTADTFYTIQNDIVEPKLTHEERRLAALVQANGPSQSQSQRKEIAAQESFVEELRMFRQEIARIAPLWRPALDDGVIINFALLWRLVPHNRAWQKECKEAWDLLVEGKCDWANLALRLWPERVIGKCVADRSLAIAHNLEEELWEEDPEEGCWEPRDDAWDRAGVLVQRHTSPAVQAALKSLLEAPAPVAVRSVSRGSSSVPNVAAKGEEERPLVGARKKRDPAAVPSEVAQKVRATLIGMPDGATKSDLLAATGVPDARWATVSRALIAQGIVRVTGQRRGTRYHLADPTGDA